MSDALRRPGLEVRAVDSEGGGSREAWWGDVRALVKPNSDDHPSVVLNELVCARLASALGLPVPMGEVGEMGHGRQAWVSAQVQLRGQTVAPADPAVIVQAQEHLVAGCTVFDVWVNNVDRHDENMIYHPSLGLWLIDHDQALAGPEADVAGVLDGSHALLTPIHAFRGHVSQAAASPWLEICAAVPASVVEGIVDDVRLRRLVSPGEAAALLNFLLTRQVRLAQLVQDSVG